MSTVQVYNTQARIWVGVMDVPSAEADWYAIPRIGKMYFTDLPLADGPVRALQVNHDQQRALKAGGYLKKAKAPKGLNAGKEIEALKKAAISASEVHILVRETLEKSHAVTTRQWQIFRAIGRMLHNGEGFGKDQKPDVARLVELTGLKDITADERDVLWNEVSA